MQNHPVTFQDRVRTASSGLMTQLGSGLYRMRVHPDVITLLGLVGVVIAAVVIGSGQLELGGIILLLSLPLDALDGAVARAMGRTGKFGGLLDSTCDRYADALIYAGLGYYFATRDQFDLLVLCMAALMGSFVVSYVRARAGEAGLAIRIGLMDRLVRVALILVGLLFPVLLVPVLWVLAVGSNFTGLQRLWYAHKYLAE
jgi:phosphatidylglycerophosphate synthase